jgi:hypothetical protein
MSKRDQSEQRLLKLVSDYMNGRFTINSEKPLLEEIISLVSPKLTADDVFDVIFEGEIETPVEGMAALRALAEKKS